MANHPKRQKWLSMTKNGFLPIAFQSIKDMIAFANWNANFTLYKYDLILFDKVCLISRILVFLRF